MSRRRILLVTTLILLVIAAATFLTASVLRKSPEPVAPVIEKIQQPLSTEEVTVQTLEPLPADNKEAIESEILNIENEINSAIETELDDLSDIEISL